MKIFRTDVGTANTAKKRFVNYWYTKHKILNWKMFSSRNNANEVYHCVIFNDPKCFLNKSALFLLSL